MPYTGQSHGITLINPVQLLDNHGTSGATTIANRGHTIFTRLQLVEKSDQDTGA